jgi:hypothetical protein
MKRGLFRLWVLFSAIWLLAGGFPTIQMINNWRDARKQADAACYNDTLDGPWCKYQKTPSNDPYDSFSTKVGVAEENRGASIPFPIGSFLFYIGVPILVLAFWISVTWVAAGFRKPTGDR